MTVARRRCPQAVVLPRNMERYHEASKKVMAVMHRYSDLVEVVGMDEAYVDLTRRRRKPGPGRSSVTFSPRPG